MDGEDLGFTPNSKNLSDNNYQQLYMFTNPFYPRMECVFCTIKANTLLTFKSSHISAEHFFNYESKPFLTLKISHILNCKQL